MTPSVHWSSAVIGRTAAAASSSVVLDAIASSGRPLSAARRSWATRAGRRRPAPARPRPARLGSFASECSVPSPGVAKSIDRGDRGSTRCHSPRGQMKMEPARTGERTGPPSVSVTTSASPSRMWSSSSPVGWRSQCEGSEKRDTPTVHRLSEARNRIVISGRSPRAARRSCATILGSRAISSSRARMSSAVTSGLPALGGAPPLDRSSARRRALNASRGRSRRSAATRSSATRRGFMRGKGARGSAIRASTASSSSSIALRSAIRVTQPRPQILQAAELELLHGALRAPELVRDLADPLLLGEAHHDDAVLVRGELADEPEELRALLDVLEADLGRLVGAGDVALLCRAFRPVDDRVGGDPEEPRREGDAPPLEAGKVGERLVEHLGGEVLGLVAVADAAHDEGIHPLEVVFVQLGEAARVPLGGLDQKALGLLLRGRVQGELPTGHGLLTL